MARAVVYHSLLPVFDSSEVVGELWLIVDCFLLRL